MANTCAHCGWHYMKHGSKNQCPKQSDWVAGTPKRRFKRRKNKQARKKIDGEQQ